MNGLERPQDRQKKQPPEGGYLGTDHLTKYLL
jgi:hypothetical protein